MAVVERLRQTVQASWFGDGRATDLAIACLLAQGHLLIEDVPGVGKTTLARALADGSGATFRRVQCTSDLLPSDITGSLVLDRATQTLLFRPGPVFTHVLLADELNRATPRCQSALLEAMQERGVTVDGTTHALPDPFFVIATQNPLDLDGTHPLPDSQLDRFLMRVALGYPTAEAELAIIEGSATGIPSPPPLRVEDIRRTQAAARAVVLHRSLSEYILAIVRLSRDWSPLVRGASPRAAKALADASRAWALVNGRKYVTPEDVRATAGPVLNHRVVPRSPGREGEDASSRIVLDLLQEIPAPR